MKNKEFNFSPGLPIEAYADERIIFNLKRYRTKAKMCRETYLYSSLVAIVLGSSVPVLINLNVNKLVTTLISFTVVIIVAIENVFHFRDRWKNYQIAEELLRREQYLFETKSDPYSKLDGVLAYALLVKNIEAIIKDERDKTIQARSSEIKLSKSRSE